MSAPSKSTLKPLLRKMKPLPRTPVKSSKPMLPSFEIVVTTSFALWSRYVGCWMKGSPDPDLARTDATVVYIHPAADKRLEGLPALKELYERYRGIPLFDSYEILNPMVQTAGDVAILTYQLAQRNGSATTYWNATEVYRRKDQGWRIIHTHWSAAKAQ